MDSLDINGLVMGKVEHLDKSGFVIGKVELSAMSLFRGLRLEIRKADKWVSTSNCESLKLYPALS